MALQASGEITFSDIQAEYGGTNPINLSEYYSKGNAPASGQIRLGADFYGTSAWTATQATGGSVTTSGDWKIHTFTSSGTFSVTTEGTDGVEFLVVAGGGGGGQDRGGGGGAGGMRSSYGTTGGSGSTESTITMAAGSYAITIGGGGSGAPNETTPAGYGSNSVIQGKITSNGGGRGGNGATSGNGGAGGSGGGAKYASGGSGTAGQGYNGANASGGESGYGGGGGGAAGAGTLSGDPRAGGPGRANSIRGSSTTYAAGGRGATNATNPDPAGASNSGNGGPGGGWPGYQQPGKAGGSGIVVLRYRTVAP